MSSAFHGSTRRSGGRTFERTPSRMTELWELDAIGQAELVARKEAIVEKITGGVEFLFRKNKITWLKGHGRFVGKSASAISVEVSGEGETKTYSATDIIIATGSKARHLAGIPVDNRIVSDNEGALSFDSIGAFAAKLSSNSTKDRFQSTAGRESRAQRAVVAQQTFTGRIMSPEFSITLLWRRPYESAFQSTRASLLGAAQCGRAFSIPRRCAPRSRPRSARAGLPGFLPRRQNAASGPL